MSRASANKAGIANKKAEAQGMPGETVLRMSFTGMILIFLVWWGAEALFNARQPGQVQTFNAAIEAAESAKDSEPFIRTINLRDFWLFGFNSGADNVALAKGAVQKPDTPACNSGACLCLCDKECKKKEQIYCKNVAGIDKFFAKSEFRGANEGAKHGENYFLAINGDKAKVKCVFVERTQETMTFSECAAT